MARRSWRCSGDSSSSTALPWALWVVVSSVAVMWVSWWWVVRERRVAGGGPSGEAEEELLHLLHVDGVGSVAGGEALPQSGGDDGEAGPLECLQDSGELDDHVLAVAALLE